MIPLVLIALYLCIVTRSTVVASHLARDQTRNPPPTEKELRFLNWTNSHGAFFSEYLQWPQTFPVTQSRGVAAQEDIQPNTTFISLPFEIILNPTNAKKVDLGRLVPFYPKEDFQTYGIRPFDRMVT